MARLQRLLENNRAWVAERVVEDPEYFRRLALIQQPELLWIGCSDSRVAANVITGTLPGEVFVHRNLANLVIHTDVNMLSVLEYAVNVLKVSDVIVCGHYGCGGVRAAMTNQTFGAINKWLRHIKDVYRFHQAEVNSLPTEEERQDRLVELNVREQVSNLAKTSVIQGLWKREQRPTLHGWAYGLKTGYINPLLELGPQTAIDPIYRYDDLVVSDET
jgi:carbonic anhydrase